MVPGYSGFIPQHRSLIGVSYGVGTRAAVARHDRLQGQHEAVQTIGLESTCLQKTMQVVDNYSPAVVNGQRRAQTVGRPMVKTKYSPELGVMTGATIYLPQKHHGAALGKARHVWSKEVATAVAINRDSAGAQMLREASMAKAATSSSPCLSRARNRTSRNSRRTEAAAASSQHIFKPPTKAYVNKPAYPEKPAGHAWVVGRSGMYCGIPGAIPGGTRKW
jgi:hypothetical protein